MKNNEDRRIRKTKAAIEKALLDLLEKKDFSHITINDIAKEANVNRGTIYFHYEDKYDLLNRIMVEKLAELEGVCRSIRMDDTSEILKEKFRKVYLYFDENYRFFRLMLQNGTTDAFQNKFHALIIHEMQRSDASDESGLDHEFAIQFKVSALTGVVHWWLKEDHSLSADEMAENTVKVFLKNL